MVSVDSNDYSLSWAKVLNRLMLAYYRLFVERVSDRWEHLSDHLVLR